MLVAFLPQLMALYDALGGPKLRTGGSIYLQYSTFITIEKRKIQMVFSL